MSNNNSQSNQFFFKILNSELFKMLTVLVFFVDGVSWNISNAKNDLQKSIETIYHKIELQNLEMKYEIKQIKERQDRDFKYITDNYVKKEEFNKQQK